MGSRTSLGAIHVVDLFHARRPLSARIRPHRAGILPGSARLALTLRAVLPHHRDGGALTKSAGVFSTALRYNAGGQREGAVNAPHHIWAKLFNEGVQALFSAVGVRGGLSPSLVPTARPRRTLSPTGT